jgi:hypothetical protein
VGGPTGATPRPDAVEEFRLLTAKFEAEYSRNTGSVINVVTRSGGNDYHGNARFFYRPTFLSAARFFDQNSPTDEPVRGTDDFRRRFERKEFGGNFGGPFTIPKVYNGRQKTFFFVDYERRAQLIGDTRDITGIPTLAERAETSADWAAPFWIPRRAGLSLEIRFNRIGSHPWPLITSAFCPSPMRTVRLLRAPTR